LTRFSLTLSEIISNTTIPVWELNINNKSLFNEFAEKVSKNDLMFSKLAGAVKIIEHSCNMIRLPKTKFRVISGSLNLYEVKKGALRVYLFHEEKKGRVIITGGMKGTQKEDIERMKNIINDYYGERRY